jgi:LysM repeat protein
VVVADASVTTADTHAENKTETDSNVVPIPPTLMVTQHSSTDGTSARVTDAIELSQIDPITARKQLSELLAGGTLSASDRDKVRSELTMLGSILLFDPSMLPNDSYSRRYTIQGGDSLARIAARENINVDWRMIQRINRISNPDSIRVGQSLKLPVGTFHAIVYKSEFILELYLENEDGRILVATFPVGLGEFDGTPLGRFKVKPKSKLINPQWTNPRTGEFFSSHEPNNPIGERWIGLSGLDPDNTGFTGYGIHGTIDPNSIGQMKSMGCVRLRNDDVAIVYEALSERESTIAIRP